MSDVIGEPDFPKVRVLREKKHELLEDKINELVAKGFRLQGPVQVADGRMTPRSYVATMVKES